VCRGAVGVFCIDHAVGYFGADDDAVRCRGAVDDGDNGADNGADDCIGADDGAGGADGFGQRCGYAVWVGGCGVL
jgi:hypothetical protein